MIVTVIHTETRKEYQIDARSNNENSIKCPVCSDERKGKGKKPMTFNAQKGVGNCHHCTAKFVEKGKNAHQMKPERKEYTRPVWTNSTELSEALVKWFKGRGISQQTLIDFRITEGMEWMPQVQKPMNCIKLNYFRDGELVNIKFRTGNKLFKLVSGAELSLYHIDALKGAKECVFVEGEIDALSFHEVGIKNVVSVPNGASKGARLEYMDNCWQYLEGIETVYLGTDNDEAGRLLRDELARRIGKERCKIIDYGIYKDANEVIQAEPLLLPDLMKQAKDYPIEGIFKIEDIETRLIDLQKNGLNAGVGTSIGSFNELITWVPGYVTVITGVPNHGKGEFLDQILIDLARLHDWAFGIYSPENHPLELHVSKLASKIVGTAFNSIRKEELNGFISEFNDRFFFIMPPDDLTLESILESGRILVRKYGIKGLVIDPWNKLDHQFTGSETQYISNALDKIDMFAKTNGVHVFLVAHPMKLQREKDSKRVEVPTPYQISGSSHWFNKPANCITVYRNFFEDGSNTTTDIHVQKVKFKHWGKQGQVSLLYDYESGRYYTVGQQDKKCYLNDDYQPQKQFDLKPNTNFYEPKDKEDLIFDPSEPIPF